MVTKVRMLRSAEEANGLTEIPPENTVDQTPDGENSENGDGGNYQIATSDPSYMKKVNTKELGMKQDRFAITPLYTRYHQYALPTEYMIDETTGASALKLENGKMVSVGEEGRLRYHIANFESELGYYGMRNAVIKQAYYDDDSYIHTYKSGTNLLDDPIYIDDQMKISKMCISLDLDILQAVEDSPKLKIAEIDPDVIVHYSVDMGVRRQYTCKLSALQNAIEEMTTISLAINQIILPSDLDCILEDCLIVVHSILVGVVEDEF